MKIVKNGQKSLKVGANKIEGASYGLGMSCRVQEHVDTVTRLTLVRVVIITGALGTVFHGIISGNLRGHSPIWSSFFFNYIGEFFKALFDFWYFRSSECCF